MNTFTLELGNTTVAISPELVNCKETRYVEHKLVSEKSVPFTVELADKALSMPVFIGDREFEEGKCEELLRAAVSGTFMWEQADIIFCLCKETSLTYRIDGQHTCWMRKFLAENKHFEKFVPMIKVLKYEVDTISDLRRLYTCIDQGFGRNNKHKIRARCYGTEEMGDLKEYEIQKFGKGLRIFLEKNKGGRLSANDLADTMISTHLKLIQKTAEFTRAVKAWNFKHVDRAPTVAALLATFNKADAASHEFWPPVITGLDISSMNDPRKTLHDYLLRANIKATYGRQITTTSEDMFRGCLSAWNAFRDGRHLTVIKKSIEGSKRPPVK